MRSDGANNNVATRRVSPTGALVVAVGLGVAVVGSQGVAVADTTTTAGSSADAGPADSSAAETAHPDQDSGADAEQGSPDDSEADTGPDDDGLEVESDSEDDDEVPAKASDDAESSDGNQSSETGDEDGEPVEVPTDRETHGDGSEPAIAGRDDEPSTVPDESSLSPSGSDDQDADDTSSGTPVEEAESEPTATAVIEPDSAATVPLVVVPMEVDAPEPTSVRGARSIVDSVLEPVVNLVGVLLSPFGLGGSADPRNPLRSLLEWAYVARTRIQSAFFNSSPTVEPVVLVQVGDVVSGSLNAADADSDVLRYTVTTDPRHGTVVVNADGTFTYTPDDPGAALTDTFQVRATEAEFRFHGLRDLVTLGGLLDGLFGLEPSNSATATVVVNPMADLHGAIEVGDRPQGVAVSRDGRLAYVTNAGGNSVSVIDLESGTLVTTIADVGNYPTDVVFGEGKAFVVNTFGDSVTVIDTRNHTVVETIGVGEIPRSAATAGGQLYVVNSGDGTVSVIDTGTHAVTATIAVGRSPQHIAIGGALAYVTNFDDDTVSVIDTASGGVTATVAVGVAPQAVAISPDGTRLYVTGYDTGRVTVIDTETLTERDTVHVGGHPDAVVVSPDGERVYITSNEAGTVTILDTDTSAVVGVIDAGGTGSAIAISADGTRLYIPDFSTGTVSVAHVDQSAQPSAAALQAQGVKTVYFRNLTGKSVTFVGVEYPQTVVTSPKPGTVIEPGESVTVAVTPQAVPWFPSPQVTLQTGQPGDADFARFRATLWTDGSDIEARCQGNGGRGSCSGIDDHTVVLLAPPGSTVEVDAGDPTVQAAILTALCRNGSSCAFVADRQEETFTPSELVAYTTKNSTTVAQVTKMMVIDTETQSDSLQVSVKVGGTIAKIVNAEITATYQHTWTYTHTFQREFDITIPPGERIGVYASDPVYRVYGDFTVRYNDVTYLLKGTYFDTPNPNGQPNYDIRSIPDGEVPVTSAQERSVLV